MEPLIVLWELGWQPCISSHINTETCHTSASLSVARASAQTKPKRRDHNTFGWSLTCVV